MALDANFEAGRFKSGIEGDYEIFKKTEISEKVGGRIPREPGLGFNHVCANDEFYVVIVNFTMGTRYDPAQWTFRAVHDFQPD